MKEALEVRDLVQLNFFPYGLLVLEVKFTQKIFSSELELGGMTIIAAWWGVWHIIGGFSISTLWSKKRTPLTT